MQYIDLTILKKTPEQNMKVILEIEPLAPLSMVSELPGSYYKTLKSPDKKMLCGLFENILGWHIALSDRNVIIKDLIKERQKGIKEVEKKRAIQKHIESFRSGSTYYPLLMEYFEILLPVIPSMEFYDDLWKRAYRREDADVHPKGTINLDYRIIPLKREQPRDKEKPQKIDNGALFSFFKENMSSYPLYYSTPTTREYISTQGNFQIQIAMDAFLYEMICAKLSAESIGYLGNSEGWIELKLTKL